MAPDGIVTWAEIDLDAIAHNIEAIKAYIAPDVQIIVSVKANAYGHGLRPVARTVLEAGASQLAVHRIQAGIALREAGIAAPILLMGHIPPSGIAMVLQNRITPTLVSLETAQALSRQAETPVDVHIKIDTGMTRYGLEYERSVDFTKTVAALPRLRVAGIFSHFATADSPDLTYAREQLQRFRDVLDLLRNEGIEIPLPHLCNSAGLVTLPEAHLKGVRPGLLVYAMAPSAASRPPFEIRRALELKSTVTHVRDVPAGRSISYGRTFVTSHPIRTALVSLGYGDGYPRLLSNRGAVLIRGQRAQIRGRVCMDQHVVEVTDIPGVRVGDEVVAIGRQGDAEITADEVASWAETINYEITTGLLPQVVRVYRRHGQVPAPAEGVEQWAAYLRAV